MLESQFSSDIRAVFTLVLWYLFAGNDLTIKEHQSMPKVEVTKCGGNVDVAIRRLKRMCDRLGVLKRMRELEHHVKPTTKRRRDKDAARKRVLKRLSQEKAAVAQRRRTKKRK